MKTTKLAKFILWALTLVLAYAVTYLIDTIPLAKAFFGLHAIIGGALLVTLLLICAFGKEVALNQLGKFLIRVLRFVVAMVITGIISYAATLVIPVDFFVAYLLMTLGQSMFNVEYIEEIGFPDFKGKFSNFKLFSTKGKHGVSKFGGFGKSAKTEPESESVVVVDEEPVDYQDAEEFEKV